MTDVGVVAADVTLKRCDVPDIGAPAAAERCAFCGELVDPCLDTADGLACGFCETPLPCRTRCAKARRLQRVYCTSLTHPGAACRACIVTCEQCGEPFCWDCVVQNRCKVCAAGGGKL